MQNLTNEIAQLHKQITSTADGEWGWINKNKKSSYLASLNDPAKIQPILDDMFNHEAMYGVFSYDGLDSESHKRDLDEWKKSVKKRGNLKTKYGLLPDAPRHDYFAEKILDLKPKRILEIGGGYGGLALQLFRRNPAIQYVNIDLPETLYLCYAFLKRHGFDVQFSLDGNIKGQITLIPNTVKVKWNPDVVFNCQSLSEMDKKTTFAYIRKITREWKPKYFYHQNSDYNLFPNSERHVETMSSDYPIGDTYKLLYRIPSRWQGGGNRYREFLYKRK